MASMIQTSMTIVRQNGSDAIAAAVTEGVAAAAKVPAEQVGTTECMLDAVLSELMWCALGFVCIRTLIHLGVLPSRNTGLLDLLPASRRQKKAEQAANRKVAVKALCAAGTAGQHAEVLLAWDKEKNQGPLPLDALKDSVHALAELAPARLASDLAAHFEAFPESNPQVSTMNELLDIIVESSRPDLAPELAAAMRGRLGVSPNVRTREVLLRGFAAAGDEAKAAEMEAQLRATEGEVTARGFALAIKGLLKGGKLDAAMEKMSAMQAAGHDVPPRAVTELLKVAQGLGEQATQHVLDNLLVQIPKESIEALLSDCLQRDDADMARRVERVARSQKTPLSYVAFECLLKLYTREREGRALQVFAEMQQAKFFASEGLCGNLLARAGEVQNFALVDAIVSYLRCRSMMTLPIFKTLMKAYAGAGRFDDACDLYKQVLAAGLEPDHVMYGCLVKFAVKCGRTELSEELFNKTKGGDIQNYIWLFRAAGRDRNPGRILQLLRQAEESHPGDGGLDVSVYNCALDACVASGGREQAAKLLAEMQAKGLANLVTYNTVMKSHCADGDHRRARGVLEELASAGFKPDSASYNCLLGACVSDGNLTEAWGILAEMERKGVPFDSYTVSIMMKAAKRARTPREADRAMAVLDKAQELVAGVCSDEVLFNTVLDACIARRDHDRMRKVLEACAASKMKPTVHSYGLLIKAAAMLRQFSRCREYWREMADARGLPPNNITLCCMLDAIVGEGYVEQAVALFREWKGKVPPNTVMYSTLIKGFATSGDAARAMDMFNELRTDGLQMNHVAYTALIDAQARAGKIEQAKALFEQMQKDGCEPNVITFSTLLKGHCIQGEVDEAFALFGSMLDRGLSADTVIFNTLLDGCVKHSRFELADKLLADMTQYGVEPSNFTLSIIVKMWGKRRQLDKAFAAVRDSLGDRQRSRVDYNVDTCLLSACFHNQDTDRALEAFAEIKARRGRAGPDSSTYSTLIAGLARYGDCLMAFNVACEACEAIAASRGAMKPLTTDSLRFLCRALQQKGLSAELGAPLAAKLEAAGMRAPPAAGSAGGGWGGWAAAEAPSPSGREVAARPAAPTDFRRRAPASAAALRSLRASAGGERLEPAWRRGAGKIAAGS